MVEAENYVIRDGVVVIPRNAVIPDGTVIQSPILIPIPQFRSSLTFRMSFPLLLLDICPTLPII